MLAILQGDVQWHNGRQQADIKKPWAAKLSYNSTLSGLLQLAGLK